MTPLTTSVRHALKQKWMNNDHKINITAMATYFNTDCDTLREIIRQYESELLVTKFEIQ